MGGAIAHAGLTQSIAGKITIIDPADTLISNASVCLLAVKPQVMDDICAPLKNALSDDCLILSIAAGKTITGFETLFGAEAPIIRAMPNTPAMIGEGISVLCPPRREPSRYRTKHVTPKRHQPERHNRRRA